MYLVVVAVKHTRQSESFIYPLSNANYSLDLLYVVPYVAGYTPPDRTKQFPFTSK